MTIREKELDKGARKFIQRYYLSCADSWIIGLLFAVFQPGHLKYQNRE